MIFLQTLYKPSSMVIYGPCKYHTVVRNQFPCTVVYIQFGIWCVSGVLLDFSLTVKAAPHECVIRTSQP